MWKAPLTWFSTNTQQGYESSKVQAMNELGELRPSQLIFTFGVGSLVDLPNMSAMVMGLDDWDTRYCKELEKTAWSPRCKSALDRK
jgi:hypothetical protein